MVCQGLFKFLQHGIRNAGLADEDHGFEAVTQAPQYFPLSFSDIHQGEYNGVGPTRGMN